MNPDTPKLQSLISEVNGIILNSVDYINKTNTVYQKYLKRRIIAKDSQNPKEELEKARRIFEGELNEC